MTEYVQTPYGVGRLIRRSTDSLAARIAPAKPIRLSADPCHSCVERIFDEARERVRPLVEREREVERFPPGFLEQRF